MERLTRQDENGLLICYPNNKTGLGEFATQQNPYRRIIEKLAEYEDMEEIFRSKMTGISCDFLKDKEEFAKWLDRNIWTSKKLDEYARAEEQGKLLSLPAAVGETVYVLAECEKIDPQLDGTLYGDNGGFGTATGYYCPYENDCPFDDDDFESCENHRKQTAVFEDSVSSIQFSQDCGLQIFTNNCSVMGLFGQDVFLTKESAEAKLREMEI